MPPNASVQYRHRLLFQPQAELGLATSGELGVDVWEAELSRLRDRRRRCRLWSLKRGKHHVQSACEVRFARGFFTE